ncbi:hypothetical protein TL16_g03793 [Triparma laevis f. inornata]|uniref:RING-type domain-containing protein n=1 Tax=Triparma laevis f. inornata TaxID=1714386 RepID=A0A9W7A6E8_9STRA|nr:hypothetical protein TL16_g03793 [Triparma laevis f. inornata]
MTSKGPFLDPGHDQSSKTPAPTIDIPANPSSTPSDQKQDPEPQTKRLMSPTMYVDDDVQSHVVIEEDDLFGITSPPAVPLPVAEPDNDNENDDDDDTYDPDANQTTKQKEEIGMAVQASSLKLKKSKQKDADWQNKMSSNNAVDDFGLRLAQMMNANSGPVAYEQGGASAPPKPREYYEDDYETQERPRKSPKLDSSMSAPANLGRASPVSKKRQPTPAPPHNPPPPQPSNPSSSNPPGPLLPYLTHSDPFRYANTPLQTLSSKILPPPLESMRYYRNTSFQGFLNAMRAHPCMQTPTTMATLPPATNIKFSPSVTFTISGVSISVKPTFEIHENMQPFEHWCGKVAEAYGLTEEEQGRMLGSILSAYENAKGERWDTGRIGPPPTLEDVNTNSNFFRTFKDESNTIKNTIKFQSRYGATANDAKAYNADSVHNSVDSPAQDVTYQSSQKCEPCLTDLTESISSVQSFFSSITPKHRMTFEKKLICHLCHKVVDGVCLKFGPDCSHAYCKNHVLSRFARSVDSLQKAGDSLRLQCPVCAGACECKSCEKKLLAKAKKYEEFKRKGQIKKFEEIEKGIILKTAKNRSPTPSKKSKGVARVAKAAEAGGGGGKRGKSEGKIYKVEMYDSDTETIKVVEKGRGSTRLGGGGYRRASSRGGVGGCKGEGEDVNGKLLVEKTVKPTKTDGGSGSGAGHRGKYHESVKIYLCSKFAPFQLLL